MTLEPQVRSFLAGTIRYATIATLNPDGSPLQVVVWFLLREDAEGGTDIVVNSRRGRRWPANLARDGRASVAVFEATNAVTLDCQVVDTYDGERAQADIAEMAQRYDQQANAAAEVARFTTEDRVTFILQPTRAHIHGDPR